MMINDNNVVDDLYTKYGRRGLDCHNLGVYRYYNLDERLDFN